MGTIKKITAYLLRKGLGVLRINVFVTNSTASLNQIKISDDFSLRPIDDQVLHEISLIRGKKKYNQLKKVYDTGGYGISFFKAGELAAYGWIGLNREKKSRRMFTSFAIPPNSGHIFDCYTVEKYRGQKLYQAVVYHLVQWAKDQQAGKVYIDTVEGNNSAYKGVINLGFEYLSLHTSVLLFNKTIFEYDHKR